MYTKHKYSELILKLKGFRFEQENSNTKSYIKTVISKDEFNYYMEYYIHYVWVKEEEKARVFVSSWTSRFYSRQRGYDTYTGIYEQEGQEIMKKLRIKIKGLVYEEDK